MTRYTGHEYVFLLPPEVQVKIERAVRAKLSYEGIRGDELRHYVQDAMNSRLIDLEDTIDVPRYLKMANQGVPKTAAKKTATKKTVKKKTVRRR